MGSFSVVCSPQADAVVCDSLVDFEAWLTRTFPDTRILERSGSGVRALEWTRGDSDRGTTPWMHGSINEDRTTLYLRGDVELVTTTAVAARDLFSAAADVVYMEDWQGIPFDLRKVADADVLARAVEQWDLDFEWHDAAQAVSDRSTH